jgi:hypothetical protein
VPSDPDVLRERLRIETAKMLRIDDLETMTAADGVRFTRACMLRLELDDIEARKIHDQHQPFDAKAYVAASEALERMMGGQPEQTNLNHDFAGAREELSRFLVARAQRIEARDQNRDAALREENALLREENARLTAMLKAEPWPAPQPNNVVAIRDANAALPPAHYLRDGQRREDWQRGPTFDVPSFPIDPRR